MLWRVPLVTLFGISSGCFFKPGPPSALGDATIGDTTSDTNGLLPNLMFVTAAPATISTYRTVSELDRVCQDAADAKPLSGTYRAWTSSSFTDAKTHLGGTSGWLRPDNEPFATSVAELAAGHILYPPVITENGQRLADGELVYTATSASGTFQPGKDCSGLTGTGPIGLGFADAGAPLWTESGSTLSCSNPMHLYCFGIGFNGPVTKPLLQGYRVAFLSEGTLPVSNMMKNGLAGADAICAGEATTAGINGSFHALLGTATGTTIATERFNTTHGPWVRPDGVVVTQDLSTFEAPLDLTASGIYASYEVFFGAPSPTAPVTGACAGWTDTGSSTSTGLSSRSTSTAFSGQSLVSCGTPEHVYCFED